MNKKEVLVAITRARELSRKRNFEQSIDFGINFTGIDFKRPENRIDLDVSLSHSTGKQAGAKALVFVQDKIFAEQLSGKAKVIMESEIQNLKAKQVDELLSTYNVFLAQGPAILAVGKYLGQQLAPKAKMPKSITTDIKLFDNEVSKASTSIKVTNAKGKYMPLVHVMVGKEKDEDEKISDNVLSVYESVLNAGTVKKINVKSSFVKLTMGPAIKIGLNEDELKLLKQKQENKTKKTKDKKSNEKGEIKWLFTQKPGKKKN